MWAYPFDYVGSFIHRPRPMKQEDFNKAKSDLAKTIETLQKEGA